MTKTGVDSPLHSPKPGVSSPWNKVVAAGTAPPSSPSPPPPAVESTAVNSMPAEEPDNGVGHNVNSVKRSAWNKPSNGASSSVMGADSWPALSKSAKAPSKSHSLPASDSAKGLIDAPPLQGTGMALPSPQRQFREHASPMTHQKSFKRGSSNPSSNGGHPSQPSGPQGLNAALVSHNHNQNHNHSHSHSHNHNSSSKDHLPRSGFVSNDHPPQRNSFRHRNGNAHQRGDGAYHHNYAGRRDLDRGNHNWNTNRNFNGRDNYMSPRLAPRFIRPPQPPNPAHMFPPPPLMHPYGASYGFPELPPPPVFYPPPLPLDSLRGVPFVPPLSPNAVFFKPMDPQLHSKIVKQVDYYFSAENLVTDGYLRQNMDDQGWVPINLIAGFNKIKHLTDSIPMVLDAVRTSSVVEVQGDKIRVRNDWRKWIFPRVKYSDVTDSQTDGQLAEQVQSIALGSTNNDGAQQPDVSQNRPLEDF